jgi:hypothetical protein
MLADDSGHMTGNPEVIQTSAADLSVHPMWAKNPFLQYSKSRSRE